jgi:hypothetical protein
LAWSDLAVQTPGTLAPAAYGNAIRDNFLASGPHLIVRKPADEGPISSTTFQADNDLIAPVGANETWIFMLYTRWVAASAADVKMRWTFPASPVMAALQFVGRNAAGTVADFQQQTATSPMDPGAAMFSPVTSAFGFVLGPIWLMFANGANAGSFAFEWAPNSASNLTCKANSTLWGVKLA